MRSLVALLYMAIGLGAVLSLTGACAPALASDQPSLDLPVLSAGQVYDRALGFARAQDYPPYLSFVVTVRAQVKDRWLIEQFQSLCRTRDDRVVTNAKPLSTTNAGDNPYGFNVNLRGLKMHNSKDIDEPFGLPEISPMYAFGLTRLHPSTSTLREYDLGFAGIETVHDRQVYHITLTPRGDPAHQRLRDLWIDVTSYAVTRLVSAGAFSSGPATAVDWDVTYKINHGYWLIDSESTAASMLLGGYAPPLNGYVHLPGATIYRGVSYSFSDFAFPEQVSDLLFFEFKPSQAVQM